jgi:hypothetical protein
VDPKSNVSAPSERSGALRRLDRLAYLLDNSIPVPGTGRRFGLDAVIGLVPGVGDAAGVLVSAYVVLEAARLGTPLPVLLRMVLNVAVEGVVGSVPVLGDLFDAGWKANARNVRLLNQSMERPDAARRSGGAVVLGTFLLLLVLLGGVAFLVFLVLRALAGALG